MNFGFIKILLLVAFCLAHRVAVADETCVAKAGGGWNCGKDVTASDGAPLPRAERTSRPPLLLIDPRRFGEGGDESFDASSAAESPPTKAQAQPTAAVTANQAAPAASEVEAQKGEVVSIPAVSQEPGTRIATLADAELDANARTGNGYTIQLAVASSTKGFDKLRGELKLARSNTRELPLKNGNFALLMGVFPTLEAARAAIPSAAKGAFAREIRALENL